MWHLSWIETVAAAAVVILGIRAMSRAGSVALNGAVGVQAQVEALRGEVQSLRRELCGLSESITSGLEDLEDEDVRVERRAATAAKREARRQAERAKFGPKEMRPE